jgi:hypothetical protein
MSSPEIPEATLQSNTTSPDTNSNDAASSTKDEHSPERLPKGQGDIDAYATTFEPGWRFYLAFSSLLVITLMAALDATSLSVAIPKITTSLNGSAIEGFWSGTSFLLTSTGMSFGAVLHILRS